MIVAFCDLCGKKLKAIVLSSERPRLEVKYNGMNKFTGDVCPDCLNRVYTLLNLPKDS